MKINLVKTQRLLSPTQISIADHVINPYRGCQFGCKYCYVQFNKQTTKENLPWGQYLYVKQNAPQILKKEIIFKRPKHILIGSTTESFPEVEKQFKITKQILEILKEQNIPFTLLTRSPVIEDYLDLLSYNENNRIFFTITKFLNNEEKILEKNAPNLEQRINTVKKIINKGIYCRLHLGPIIPMVSDFEFIFDDKFSFVKQLEIEVYNGRMGNIDKIIALLKKPGIKDFYTNKETYELFQENLINKVNNLNKNLKFDINFIIPEFDSFYQAAIKY